MLMRVAPNLASWLGGSVFTYEDIDALAVDQRDSRLASLRAWSGKTDESVIKAAEEGICLVIQNMLNGWCWWLGETC